MMRTASKKLLATALLVALAGTPATAQRISSPLLPGGTSRAPVSIDSSKLDYFDKEQKLVYSGGVVAKQGESTLHASSLSIFLAASPTKSAEGGAAAGGATGSDVKRMEAAGPVTISSKDQVGMGDSAVYDKLANKLYLIGNVSLSQGGSVIKGLPKSRLIYDLTSGQAQIEGGVTSLILPGAGSDPGKKPAEQKAESKPRKPEAKTQ